MMSNSPRTRSPNPYAVVVGLDCFTGLQTARILAGRGVPVIGVAGSPDHYCCCTRVCDRQVYTDVTGVELIETLVSLGQEFDVRAVLYPCTDGSVELISRHRGRLEKSYHVVLPDPDVVETLLDKMSFVQLAQREGLPVPQTFFLHSRDDAEAAAAKLKFPCVLKPPKKSPAWSASTTHKAFKVSSADELLSLYDRYAHLTPILMAQEWIDGTDADLFSCNCYFDAESRPLVTFVARKLRQWPPEAGTSCLGEEVRNDEVLDTTVRLFATVGYYGLGYVEMKRCAETGSLYVIEPNIGRPTGRSAIAEAGGVEMLYAMYCDVTGLPLPDGLTQRYTGVKWIYLRRDLQSAFYYFRRGELTLRDWWGSLRGKKAFALFSWKDPAPFFGDLRHALAAALKKLRRRFARGKENSPGQSDNTASEDTKDLYSTTQ